jgi:hypothetical protein
MRSFAAVAFAVLSLSSFTVAASLDNQIVLSNHELVEEPRWSYSICGATSLYFLVLLLMLSALHRRRRRESNCRHSVN